MQPTRHVLSYTAACFLILALAAAGCIMPFPTGGTTSAQKVTVATPTAVNTNQQSPGGTGSAGGACPQSYQTYCNGHCSDLSVDIGDCGSCGHTCGSGQSCVNGVCTAACASGLTFCNGYCRDLATDPANCGACGIECPSGQTCSAGSCVSACPTGLKLCSGYCRDTTADVNNCGTCGIVCPSGYVCSAGVCGAPIPTCVSGQTNCNNVCTYVSSDVANCGSCGHACASGQVCSSGTCTAVCTSGQTNCGGSCADLQTNHENCGTCGHACTSLQSCESGSCKSTLVVVSPHITGYHISCAALGKTDCSGTCVDTQTDPANCGSCGTTCLCGCSGGHCCGINPITHHCMC